MAQQVTAQYRPRVDAKIEKPAALLGGMVFCGYCGGRMYRKGRGTSKHPLHYKCDANSHRVLSEAPRCNGKSLVAAKAEAIVWDCIKLIVTTPDMLKDAISKQTSDDSVSRLSENMEVVQKQIENITKAEARHIRQLSVVSEDIVELVEKELAILSQRKKSLNTELQKLARTYSSKKAKVVDYSLLSNWLEIIRKNIDRMSREDRIRLLNILGTQVFIDGPDNIEIKMLFDPSKASFVEQHVTVYKGEKPQQEGETLPTLSTLTTRRSDRARRLRNTREKA